MGRFFKKKRPTYIVLALVVSYELGSGVCGKSVLVYWSRTRYIVLVLVVIDEQGHYPQPITSPTPNLPLLVPGTNSQKSAS